jgi:hypothetical protein
MTPTTDSQASESKTAPHLRHCQRIAGPLLILLRRGLLPGLPLLIRGWPLGTAGFNRV